jgi:hypothetical protein
MRFTVLTIVSIKITALWNVTDGGYYGRWVSTCVRNLFPSLQRFKGRRFRVGLGGPEDGSRRFLRNIGTYLPHYMAYKSFVPYL